MGARVWFRLGHPRIEAAAVIVVWEGRLLLLRNSYRAEPSLPGGLLKRGETPAAGASRELAEEVGLVVAPTEFRFRETFPHEKWGARIRLHLFEWRAPRSPAVAIDRREVVEACFLPRAEVARELPHFAELLARLSEPGVW